jgi:hypothetical protein
MGTPHWALCTMPQDPCHCLEIHVPALGFGYLYLAISTYIGIHVNFIGIYYCIGVPDRTVDNDKDATVDIVVAAGGIYLHVYT